MRIAIGNETTEINEEAIRVIQNALSVSQDLDWNLGNYKLKEWIDAILSHFAKMLNYQKPVFTKEEKERISEMQKPSKKVEIDVEDLKTAMTFVEDHSSCQDGQGYYWRIMAAIEKAEREEAEDKSYLKFHPEFDQSDLDAHREVEKKRQWEFEEKCRHEDYMKKADELTELLDQKSKIDSLEKRVESLMDIVGKIQDRQIRFMDKLEEIKNKN